MKENIFIPKTITVGYQERKDTYTGKLAYVIYTDQKGVLRKEKSWESWRDKKIESVEFENIPVSGFVLNKKVGGYSYSWNPRQTYTRVYDPRGFEFEITIPNLLYILENANSIKGKGLDGEFIYGWSGADLVLIPREAPEYKAMLNFTNIQGLKISKKDLVPGWNYLNKKNEVVTYMGYYDEYDSWYGFRSIQRLKGKKHWFYQNGSKSFITYSSINHLVRRLDGEINFATIFDEMEKQTCYSPVYINEITFEQISEEGLFEILKSKSYAFFYVGDGEKLFSANLYSDQGGFTPHYDGYVYENFQDIKDNNRQYKWGGLSRDNKQNLTYYVYKLKLKNGKEIIG